MGHPATTAPADINAGEMMNPVAWFDRGIALSTGADDSEIDLIEAHKCFNLAAMAGNPEAHHWRAEIAGEMTSTQIARALRDARVLLDRLSLRTN